MSIETDQDSFELFENNLPNEEENRTLKELYDQIWSYHRYLEHGQADFGTDEAKGKILSGIRLLRIMERKLNEIHLFSENETIEEVPTEDLKYFLTYALLANFYQMKPSKVNNRLEAVEQACKYFNKFLRLCCKYGEVEEERIPKETSIDESEMRQQQDTNNKSRTFDIIEAARARAEKIQTFKKRKEEEKVVTGYEELLDQLEKQSSCQQVDDEVEHVRRKLYTKRISLWIEKSIEDLSCLHGEKGLLMARSFSNMSGNAFHETSAHPRSSGNVLLLTLSGGATQRDQVLSATGYRAVPQMSIEQFYDDLAKRGIVPCGSDGTSASRSRKHNVATAASRMQTNDEEEEREHLEEMEDRGMDDQLKKNMMDMDDWKDMHFKGEGNRYNRS